jgi:ABC-type cobalamin transport system ATPase subunit
VGAHRLGGSGWVGRLERHDDPVVIGLVLTPALGRRAPALQVTPDVPVPGRLDRRHRQWHGRWLEEPPAIKMLAMGRVLMLRPSVFLLDEPTANLAPAIAGSLLEHVRRLADDGAAVLIVEQRARAVLTVSDHTYVMGGGELRMEGSPAKLAESPDFVASFLGGHR